MTGPEYLWMCRWEEFQHYAPERDKAPGWIKTYTKQHDDDDYLNLTADQRGLLHDLRILFARSHGKLTTDTRRLTHRLCYRVMTPQLEALNHAGFVEFVSREVLDQRLEMFYASRARARAHQKEEETEIEKRTNDVKSKALPSTVSSYAANTTTKTRVNDEHQTLAPLDFLDTLQQAETQ